MMSVTSAASTNYSSTKGVANAEWDKVFLVNYARGLLDGLFFFLVENNGFMQLQTMSFRNILPFVFLPMDIV
jgi:hypothetical protein